MILQIARPAYISAKHIQEPKEDLFAAGSSDVAKVSASRCHGWGGDYYTKPGDWQLYNAGLAARDSVEYLLRRHT